MEEVLAVCTRVRHGEVDEALSDELLARIRQVTATFNAEGLRVVAVAARPMLEGRDTYSLADEQALTLIGYVAFLDPPKESTAPALKALAAHGVAVKVLTGDNEWVTAKICREVGLEQQGLLMGNDIERMSDAELAVAVETTNVFAKLTPSHKERIVRLLKGGRGCLPADGTAGALLQIAGVAVAVLCVLAGDFAGVHGTDPGSERLLHSPVWLAVKRAHLGKVLQKTRQVFRSLAPSRIRHPPGGLCCRTKPYVS